jgi:hypothetical protein
MFAGAGHRHAPSVFLVPALPPDHHGSRASPLTIDNRLLPVHDRVAGFPPGAIVGHESGGILPIEEIIVIPPPHFRLGPEAEVY